MLLEPLKRKKTTTKRVMRSNATNRPTALGISTHHLLGFRLL